QGKITKDDSSSALSAVSGSFNNATHNNLGTPPPPPPPPPQTVAMKAEDCIKCSGRGKMYKNDDPKTEQWTICAKCKGQGKMGKDENPPASTLAASPSMSTPGAIGMAEKDESGTSGGAAATPGMALAEKDISKAGMGPTMPGGAGIPKLNVKPQMPKPMVMPSNN